jgi:hypothetical protein
MLVVVVIAIVAVDHDHVVIPRLLLLLGPPPLPRSKPRLPLDRQTRGELRDLPRDGVLGCGVLAEREGEVERGAVQGQRGEKRGRTEGFGILRIWGILWILILGR